MNITYENLSDSIAEEINEDVRNEVNLGDTISEKELDNMIWAKVSEACPGDLDHFDVVDMTIAKFENWDAIVPYGA